MSTECVWAEAPPPERRASKRHDRGSRRTDPVDAPVVRSRGSGTQITESAAPMRGCRCGGSQSARNCRCGSSSCVAVCPGGHTCRRIDGREIPGRAGSSSHARAYVCAAPPGSCPESAPAATTAACAPGWCDFGVLAGSAPATAPPVLTAWPTKRIACAAPGLPSAPSTRERGCAVAAWRAAGDPGLARRSNVPPISAG